MKMKCNICNKEINGKLKLRLHLEDHLDDADYTIWKAQQQLDEL